MRTLYESILDNDFDAKELPKIKIVGGVDKLTDIIYDFCDKGHDVGEGCHKRLDAYVLPALKNIFDFHAKLSNKKKPTKKWAIMAYKHDICRARNRGQGGWMAPEELFIFSLGPDGSIREYSFTAYGNLVDRTILKVKNSWIVPNYIFRYRYQIFQIPIDICNLIDWCLESRGIYPFAVKS